jgi:hypothetical protein
VNRVRKARKGSKDLRVYKDQQAPKDSKVHRASKALGVFRDHKERMENLHTKFG